MRTAPHCLPSMAIITAARKGITCPTCSARTRVLGTDHAPERTLRQRICKRESHFFVTREVPIGERHEEPLAEDPSGHPCTRCGSASRVLQTRSAIGMVKRKRCCTSCSHVFHTKEYPRP